MNHFVHQKRTTRRHTQVSRVCNGKLSYRYFFSVNRTRVSPSLLTQPRKTTASYYFSIPKRHICSSFASFFISIFVRQDPGPLSNKNGHARIPGHSSSTCCCGQVGNFGTSGVDDFVPIRIETMGGCGHTQVGVQPHVVSRRYVDIGHERRV